MKQLLSVLLITCCECAFGQVIKYAPGYFITRDGVRTDCEVVVPTNRWRDNPRSFDYRTTPDGKPQPAVMDNVNELGLASGEVFKRFEAPIDRSPDAAEKLREARNPEFRVETIFLRLLITGKASLYQYDEGNLHRFFYSTDTGKVEQLVYKRYLTPNSESIVANEDYKQQLLNSLKCADMKQVDFQELSYNQGKLETVFRKYNGCMGGETVAHDKRDKSTPPIYLTFRGGYALSGMTVDAPGVANPPDVSGMSSFRAGLEAEFTLPRTKGLMTIPLEVAYMPISGRDPSGVVKIEGSTVDLLLGLRVNVPVGEAGKAYLTVGAVYGIPSGTVTIGFQAQKMDMSNTLLIAGGYKFRRLSAEVSWGPDRGTVVNQLFTGNLSVMAFNFGYRIK